jgi:hypothetical protein
LGGSGEGIDCKMKESDPLPKRTTPDKERFL